MSTSSFLSMSTSDCPAAKPNISNTPPAAPVYTVSHFNSPPDLRKPRLFQGPNDESRQQRCGKAIWHLRERLLMHRHRLDTQTHRAGAACRNRFKQRRPDSAPARFALQPGG